MPINWPTENTAFLVIHGNGPARQYETLDKFARKFRDVLSREVELEWKHKLDDRARSYVRFERTDYPYIDFYEYYWDRFMVRDITAKELGDWLKELDTGIDNFRHDDPSYNPPLFKLFRICGRFPLLRILLWMRNCLPEVISDLILNTIIGFAKDTVIYCLHNQRSSYYEIREKMLHGAVDELKSLLNSSANYRQIIVVGHSLGAVIAHDAFNKIARDMIVPNPKIKGWVTFGSFLDVVALFFQVHVNGQKNYMEKQITDQRHAFKEKLPAYGHNPVNYGLLQNVKWLNLYHPDDFISNCKLIAYKLDPGDDQVKCDTPIKAGCCKSFLYKIPIVKLFTKSMAAHGSYWEDDMMYEEIASRFF